MARRFGDQTPGRGFGFHRKPQDEERDGAASGVIESDPSRDVSVRTLLPPSHGKRHFKAVTDPADMGRLMLDV